MYLKSKIWNGCKYISSLSFSISLLLFLAFISILGTVIEQDQSLDYYKLHYPSSKPVLSFITWEKIAFLGLDHMYSTYWFLTILILFFLSLFICTLSTQLPVLKYSRQWNFLYSQEVLEKKNICYKLQERSFRNLIYLLAINHYFIFHKGKGLYSYKGLTGRIAPIFVHMSIIIAFVGFIIRMTSGLVVQEIVPSSEIFHCQNVVSSGFWSSLSLDIVGKVDDFFVTFNEDKSIKQFFSNISFIDSKKDVVSTKYIWVNSPMKIQGLTIYQTDWQINALRIQIGSNKFIVKNLKQVTFGNTDGHTVWVCDLFLDISHQFSIVIPSLLDSLLVYDREGELITSTSYGEWIILYGVPVLFKDLMISTGLQIKADPGIPISYFGFFILIISIITSYISYSQIWVSCNKDKLTFSGVTNRALLSFENEIFSIYKQMVTLSKSTC